MILKWLAQKRSIDRDAGVINPRIKTPEALNSFIGNPLHILELPHISKDVDRLATLRIYFISDLPERLFIPRIQHHPRPTFSSETCGYKPDSRRRTSNNDYLF